MNISVHSCRKPPIREIRLAIAIPVLLLYAFLLYSETIFALTSNSVPYYQLKSRINFNHSQCPATPRITRFEDKFQNGDSCDQYSGNHLFQYYNPYNSVFHQHSLRPFSLCQQLAMLEVFDTLGLSEHHNNLITMINLTQKKNLSVLTRTQLEQATDWREVEGSVVHERACLNDSECKEKTAAALFRMGMYDTQLPSFQQYDYTLFLGGSIQQMQWRMMMMLSLFFTSIKNDNFDLGQIIALTCNRLVLKGEADESLPLTMFDVSHDQNSGRAKAYVTENQEVLLTETTSYQAIYYSLKRMSRTSGEPEYFDRFRETSYGYHPTQPIDYLARSSYEQVLYKKLGFTFQLSKELPGILEKFFERYPDAHIFETSMQRKGETLKKRPTTKQTVKEWLRSLDNKLTCQNPNFCKILVISNAPNTFYQHTAVLQALEESITQATDLTYEVSTAGPGASMDIPTNALLDNLTKLLYLEAYHPEY